MSRHQHGYPCSFLTTPSDRPLLPAGLLGLMRYTCYNVQVVCVSIRRTDFYFGVSIEHHYGCDDFFWEAIGK